MTDIVQPSWKAEEVETKLTSLMGTDRRECIKSAICTRCNKPATTFTDALSLKEFTISGFCQACQDYMFGSDCEDEE